MIQLSLPEATSRKASGQSLVEEHNQDFVEMMREEARWLCANGGTVTSDDLRRIAQRMGLVPKHPNCWGAVFHGDFVPVGYTKSKLVSSHARTIRIWRTK